jgi:hypothetical protein
MLIIYYISYIFIFIYIPDIIWNTLLTLRHHAIRRLEVIVGCGCALLRLSSLQEESIYYVQRASERSSLRFCRISFSLGYSDG